MIPSNFDEFFLRYEQVVINFKVQGLNNQTKVQGLDCCKYENAETKLLQTKVQGLNCYFHEIIIW